MKKRPAILIGLVFLALNSVRVAIADDYLSDAQRYFASREYKSAVIQLKNLLRDDPQNGEGRLLLGKCYIELRDGESAIKELTRARELGVSSELWAVQLAVAYLITGKHRELLEEIRPEIVASDTVKAEIYANRAMAELALKNDEKAENNITIALELAPESVEVLIDAARLAGSKREFTKAQEYARRAVKIQDNNADAWMILGEVDRALGDNQGAIKKFDKAQAVSPDFLPAQLSRAMARASLQDFEAAEKDLKHIRKIAGDVPMALYLQGLIDFERKSYTDAENSLNKVVSIIPDHWPSLLLLGKIAFQNDQFETAFTHLTKYLSGIPNDLSAIKLLAATKKKMHRHSEAIELLESVRAKVPKDYQLLALLGNTYLEQGNFDKATELLTEASELAPEDTSIHAQLGLIHFGTGSFEQAAGELETAIDLGTDLSQAEVLLVLSRIRQGNYDAAIDAAQKLQAKMPENPLPDNLLGLAYFAKGDEVSARKHWEKILAIHGGFVSGAMNLAKIEMLHKDYSAAAKWYERIVGRDPDNVNALLGLVELGRIQKNEEMRKKWLDRAFGSNPNKIQQRIVLVDYLISRGDVASAQQEIDRLNKDHPDHLQVAVKSGTIHLATGDTSSAISIFRKLVRKYPNNPELHYLFGQSWFQDGSEDIAKSEWERALQLNPIYFPAATALVGLAVRSKDYTEAIYVARQLQSNAPKRATGYKLEGDARRTRGDYTRAIEVYRKGLAVEAHNGELEQGIFLAMRASGDHDGAYRSILEWLDRHPGDLTCRMALGGAYFEDGDKAKAIPVFEQLAEKQPENVTVLNNLAWLYQESGDSRAIEVAERALATGTRDVGVIDTVGWIFLLNGQIDRSLALLQKAAQEAPGIEAVQLHYAQALLKAGRNVEAREKLEKLLTGNRNFPEKADAEKLLKSI